MDGKVALLSPCLLISLFGEWVRREIHLAFASLKLGET